MSPREEAPQVCLASLAQGQGLLLEHSDAPALLAGPATGLARADVPGEIAEGLAMIRMTALQKPGGVVRGIATGHKAIPVRFAYQAWGRRADCTLPARALRGTPPQVAELGPDAWRGDKLLAKDGFVALGTPIGTAEYTQAWGTDRFEIEEAFCDSCRKCPTCSVPGSSCASVPTMRSVRFPQG